MSQLTATYSSAAQDQDASTWIKLEQESFSAKKQQAGTDDLDEMWAYVLSGLSAYMFRAANCPATLLGGVVSIPIDFYVFPSALDLPYSLTPALGSIGEATVVERRREFDLVFDQTDEMELGYLAEDFSSTFETKAYNNFGIRVPLPSVTLEDGVVKLSRSCFCVLRVSCRALGFKHRLTMDLVKAANKEGEVDFTGYKIENLQNTIQATWFSGGELQETSLDLEIPPCVEDFLATCSDGTPKGDVDVDDDDKPPKRVGYSTCTGDELGVRSG